MNHTELSLFSPLVRLIGVTLLAFLSAFAQARAEKVAISDDQRLLWSKEFQNLYRSSSNWSELFTRLPVSPGEAKELSRAMNGKRLPALRFDGENFHFGAHQIRILDLAHRDFRFDGKLVHLEERATVLEIARAYLKSRPSRTAWLSPVLSGPGAFAADGFNTRLISPSELLWSDWTRIADHELSWVVVASDRLAPILPAVLLTDYLLVKAEAYSAPSCEKQVARLAKILAENQMALAEVDCGKSYRGNDRTLGFWRVSGNKLVKESYFCDFRMQAAEHDEPESEDGQKKDKTAYLFDYDSLVGVRTLKQIDHAEKRIDFAPGSKEFDEYKNRIEPVRRAFFHIGSNRTCDRCEKELIALEKSETPKELAEHLKKAGASEKAPAAKANHPAGQR